MKMKQKILITGASGFIGSFLVEEALRRGYEVWAAVRSTSDLSRLPDGYVRLLVDLPFHDAEALAERLREIAGKEGRAWDYVIHNAGLTKAVRKQDFFRVNAEYTRNLTEALAIACPPKKFLLMSSLSSCGAGDEKTFRPIRLDNPQRPNTVYGQSKLAAENYVQSQSSFPYIILRPTGVYGPGDKDYLIEIKSIRAGFDFAIGFTPQRITFIYVKDLASVAFLALEKEKVRNREYFVADGDVYTDASFARMIQEVVGKKHVFHARIPLVLARLACLCSEGIGRLTGKSMTLNSDKYIILKQRNWICDVAPLREELAFTPSYTLRQGLEETVKRDREEGLL
ncbi:dTDP-4-dehydrorhamnose reductase [Bacteroidales bacterium Barb4]|nr:dTDP-4-dehydrorhamnose reductase [Bacteroidales bacterium Barb4]